MKQKVIPLVLAGGRGSRFWPLSRENCPKQFLRFGGKETLLQKTLERADRIDKNTMPYIIAGEEQRELTAASVKGELGRDYGFIGEPGRRNTAAAIYYGCQTIREREGNAVFAILPADHFIDDNAAFAKDILSAATLAEESGNVVLLGVKPRYAATGFGYAEVGRERSHGGKCFYRIRRFIEKPEKKQAKKLIKKEHCYWNTGIFLFTFDTLCRLYEKHLPETRLLLEQCRGEEEIVPIKQREIYQKVESISFDKGILEKEPDILLQKASFTWDDVGSYRGLSSLLPADRRGNLRNGNILTENTSHSVIVTDNHLTMVIGVKDLIVAEDHGVLLICPLEKAGEVGKIPELLREKNSLYR